MRVSLDSVRRLAQRTELRYATLSLGEVMKNKTGERGFNHRTAHRLGRLGGLSGGPARAEKLSPEKRREIARKAAQARWSAKPGTEEVVNEA